MRMISYSAKSYELPTEGVHPARLKEIKDLEPALNLQGEEKERVRFIWELQNQVNSFSYAFKVFQTFTRSLHPRSFLAKAITDITGHEPGSQFDLDTLLGAEVDLVIKHNQADDGRVYANVATILRPKTAAEEAEAERVRAATEKVKAEARRPHTGGGLEPDGVDTNQDVPF